MPTPLHMYTPPNWGYCARVVKFPFDTGRAKTNGAGRAGIFLHGRSQGWHHPHGEEALMKARLAAGSERFGEDGLRGRGTIGGLIDRWQKSGDPVELEVLFVAVRPLVESVAVRVLRNCRIADRTAIDDVVSLVLDHLRRLPGRLAGEDGLARFRGGGRAGDLGVAFMRVLARDRSLDVARSRRRHSRHAVPLTIDVPDLRHAGGPGDASPEAERHEALEAAVGRLAPREQQVVRMLLDGKSQAVIAHVLGVCEGTVSRLRTRAIDRLRKLMTR